MDITRLSLAHFRNFAEVNDIDFPAGRLLVVAAPNATGKTNFLEAIMMLLRGKSWRAAPADCATWGEKQFVVTGHIQTQQGQSRLSVAYDVEGRKMNIREDGRPTSIVTLYSRYPVVIFLPEDTFMFAKGPAARRNFLNSVLASLPHYLSGLVQYHRALRQRNAALKQADTFEAVSAWTDVLVEQAAVVHRQREALVTFFATHLAALYRELSGEDREFSVRFRTDIEAGDLVDRYRQGFAEERRYGYTIWGPHRDDMVIRVDGRPVRNVLSQGQIRSLVIALKVASHRFLEQVSHEVPLVLFDEVLSELDSDRQQILLEHLPQSQMVLTCTELPEFLRQRDDVSLLDVRMLAEPLEVAV